VFGATWRKWRKNPLLIMMQYLYKIGENLLSIQYSKAAEGSLA
jgi:hypothetical protein